VFRGDKGGWRPAPIDADPDFFADRPLPPLTGVLVALAILVGAVYARGRLVSDTLRLDAGAGATVHLFSGQGSAAFAVSTGGDYFKDSKTWWQYSDARPPIDFRTRWANLGNETRFNRFGFVVIREPSRGNVLGVLVPCLPIAAALASMAVVRVAWYRAITRRKNRILAGQCPDCGHPMGGLAERCAHCGRARVRGGMRVGKVRNAEPARKAA